MKIPSIFFVRNALALLIFAGSLVACTYGTYDDAVARFNNNLPPPPPPPPPAGFGPNFSEIQANIFTPSCATAGCHSGAGASAGMNLEAANSYTMLVGIASSQDAGIQRVNPGNPNASYLIQKLDGTAANGAQMPLGGILAQADIDVIRQWITDGAIDDRVQASTPIRVSSLSPMPGANLSAAPMQIIAGFDRDPDASTVNMNTFILEASGGDTTFGDGNEVQIAAAMISVPVANTMSAVFDVPAATPLIDDTYRVRLLGSGASMILDLDANVLDGEFAGAFPSGDGAAGGDFEAQFSITTPVVLGPTLDQIQVVVFTPSCAGCHTGVNPPAGLDLSDADTSFLALVNMASQQQAAVLRVAPMLPDDSYLIRKLEDIAGISGGQMPPAAALPQATIDVIRQWILNGAMR